MNEPFWLYEKNVFHEKDEDALKALGALDHRYSAVEHYDLASRFDHLVANSASTPIIVRGSIAMVLGHQGKPWYPGTDWLFPYNFKCSTWMGAYADLDCVFNDKGIFMPLSLLRRRFEEIRLKL